MTKQAKKEVKFWVIFAAALTCGILGVFIPPRGVIDNSVLIFTAQLLVFAASILGIELNIENKIFKFNNKKDEKK